MTTPGKVRGKALARRKRSTVSSIEEGKKCYINVKEIKEKTKPISKQVVKRDRTGKSVEMK